MTNKHPLYRTKWRDTGKLIANFSNKEMAEFMFESGQRMFPGEIILEKIPQNETERDYGRDAEESD